MKKFLVIFALPVDSMAQMMATSTPEEREQGMQEWTKWMDDHKAEMIDPGNAVGKNTRVTKNGASEISNEIGGYSIFMGKSKEDVTKLVMDSPHFDMPGSYVEIMEIVDMM